MKKLVFSVGLVAASAFYVIFSNQSSFSVASSSPAANPPAASPNPVAAANTPLPASAPPPPKQTAQIPPAAPSSPPPAPKPVPKGQYADGTYVGSAEDAYYGTVQVKAVIQGGKIADVQFLQYPNDRSTSRYINGQAMPYLTQEAIQAQNANVDIVSGATDTSMAFQQSLASALVQAKA